MALSPEETKKVVNALKQEQRSFRDKVLASINAFMEWLMAVLYLIWVFITSENLEEKVFKTIQIWF
jgi:hypothetical protein